MIRLSDILLSSVLVISCREGAHTSFSSFEESTDENSDMLGGAGSTSSTALPSLDEARDGIAWRNNPPDEEVEYATEVRMYAACEFNPVQISFAANRQHPVGCEYIAPIAARDNDGDYYEVAVPFEWTSLHPEINLACLNGSTDNFCWPISTTDALDTVDGEEPCGLITACAQNSCPPEANDCEPEVCASVHTCSVVNIEGGWTLSWPDGATTIFSLTQVGRGFQDTSSNVRRGFILERHVTFEIDDYLFDGDFSLDRQTLSGTVTDLMGFAPAGSWSATRL